MDKLDTYWRNNYQMEQPYIWAAFWIECEKCQYSIIIQVPEERFEGVFLESESTTFELYKSPIVEDKVLELWNSLPRKKQE